MTSIRTCEGTPLLRLKPDREHGRRIVLLFSMATASLAGCDVPTGAPLIDTRWIVPSEETRFGVAQLLPGAVSVATTGDAFVVDFSPVTVTETLGNLCAACIAADGLTVPKPPFIGTFSSDIALPSQVVAISVVSGDVTVELENQMNFDPLRPAADVFGEITLTVMDDADDEVLGTLVIDGAATALPAGATLSRTVTLGAATVEGSLVSSIRVDSPLGDPVTIDVSHVVRATVTPTTIVVASATIDAAGTVVSFDPQTVDADFDNELAQRVQAGAFILDVTNPFGVSADFALTIDGPGMSPIVKPATIGSSATSTVVIPFTVDEIRQIIERESTLTGSAMIDPAAAPVTVSPGEELVLTGKLDLTLRLYADLDEFLVS